MQLWSKEHAMTLIPAMIIMLLYILIVSALNLVFVLMCWWLYRLIMKAKKTHP